MSMRPYMLRASSPTWRIASSESFRLRPATKHVTDACFCDEDSRTYKRV